MLALQKHQKNNGVRIPLGHLRRLCENFLHTHNVCFDWHLPATKGNYYYAKITSQVCVQIGLLASATFAISFNMSTRTCTKCRLRGKIAILKGHKRLCPFANCTCSRCASHEHGLELKTSQREDKGKRWRSSLNQRLRQAATATTTIPDTSSSEFKFPEMEPNKIPQHAALALQRLNAKPSRKPSK